MDVIERLTLEAAQADTMIACEHRQRYEFATKLLAGRRVIDLCCGSGYGSAILAGTAAQVLGVDRDAATIDRAGFELGPAFDELSFQVADAVEFLARPAVAEFDAIVCFEGLEHLTDLASALRLLQGHVASGKLVVASLPNDKLSGVINAFHATQFGYEEARQAFAGFDSVVMVPQFLAEGSLILPEGATDSEFELALIDRREPEYANHFIFCVGFSEAEILHAHRAKIQLKASPVFNRWSEDLKRGAAALRRENARLARGRLGKGDAAAGTALFRLAERERRIAELEERVRISEARAQALLEELHCASLVEGPGETPSTSAPMDRAEGSPNPGVLALGSAVAVTPLRFSIAEGEDPNSWELRRRRASEVLIPWIEQTVKLEGKTILEYGCGNGAVSSAFASVAGELIGVDIDGDAVAEGRRALAERGQDNAALEPHPLEGIIDAVRSRRGEIDVFLLYAVLEHLTVAERLAVLELAREVVRPGGLIVVCETPNRLTYLDHHTAQTPFFHLLPDELAARTYRRSPRSGFVSAMSEAEAMGASRLAEAIARSGRGVSFHEFEAVFDDLSRHVVASSYDPLLLGERPIHPEEVVLARYLDRVRPDLAPAWSRQWIDVILSPEAIERRPPFLRPWTAQTVTSHRIGWTAWENMRVAGPESVLRVDLPEPTQRILMGVVSDDGAPVVAQLYSERAQVPLTVQIDAAPPATGFAEFTLARPGRELTLRFSAPCHVVLVGYES